MQKEPNFPGLKLFSSRTRTVLRICRDLSLIPSLIGLCQCLYTAWEISVSGDAMAAPRSTQFLLSSIWCIVCGYLIRSVIDGLLVRWIATYSGPATVLRVLATGLLNAFLCHVLLNIMDPREAFFLPTWIFMACGLTVAYSIQNFFTSNISLFEKRARKVNISHVLVWAVVPVGIASFLTMLGLLRSVSQLSNLNKKSLMTSVHTKSPPQPPTTAKALS